MVIKLTGDTYENEVMKAEGTVLVDFYADWWTLQDAGTYRRSAFRGKTGCEVL